jgi:Spy/CpxP family protein refolding chaperone
MTRTISSCTIALLLIGGAFGTAGAGAAGAGHGAAGAAHGERAGAPAQHGGSHGGHVSAEACDADFEKVVAEGRGFGMAFSADRNGYPGPLHVVELARVLALSPEQEAQARALMHATFEEARRKGTGLLDAERRLTELFARGAADDQRVREAVATVEQARAELRLVHLRSHLRTRDLLTPAQRERYHAERWGRR